MTRPLIINKAEASTVQHIFERYAQLKNVRLLKAELARDGYVSKRRTTKSGKQTGGTSFERGALYTILKNKTYLGLTTHKGETYEGEHKAIIGKDLFDMVQTILASNRSRNEHKSNAKTPSLLAGKIVTADGLTLTPSHAQTNGRRYRYYIERRREPSIANQSGPIRLPAAEIEASVISELAGYLSDPIGLTDGLEMQRADQNTQSAISKTASDLAQQLTKPTLLREDKVAIREMVKQIRLERDVKGYELVIDLGAVAQMLELSSDQVPSETTINVKLELKVCNNGKKVIISNKPQQVAKPNPVLIKALKSAHQIKRQYLGPERPSLTKIASSLETNKRLIWKKLKLAFLAPDIQLAILSGTQPHSLCLQDLLETDLGIDWPSQRQSLGFAKL